MSEAHENKIKASIKRELIEQAELILNNRLLHAQLANATAPSKTREVELQATFAACQELRASISEIPETSEIAFERCSHSVPYFEFTLNQIIKVASPTR